MGTIIDITAHLQKKKWGTERENEFISRFIKAINLSTDLNTGIIEFIESDSFQKIPTEKRIPFSVLWRFTVVECELIVEIAEQIKKSSTLTAEHECSILTLEEMHIGLVLMFADLPRKLESYKPDVPL